MMDLVVAHIGGGPKSEEEADGWEHYAKKDREDEPSIEVLDQAHQRARAQEILDQLKTQFQQIGQDPYAKNYEAYIEPLTARMEGDTLVLEAHDNSTYHLDAAWSAQWIERKFHETRIKPALERLGYGDLQVRYEAGTGRARPEGISVLHGKEGWGRASLEVFAQLGITPRKGHDPDPEKARLHDSVWGTPYTIAAPSKAWAEADPERYQLWKQVVTEWLITRHGGPERVPGVVLDETGATPHIHAYGLNISKDGKRLTQTGYNRRDHNDLEAMHTSLEDDYQRAGLMIERGESKSLKRHLARLGAEERAAVNRADQVPLDVTLDGLGAQPHPTQRGRYTIGDRHIQLIDRHTYKEVSRWGERTGTGSIDLVSHLRQEGRDPVERFALSTHYLAVTHAGHIRASELPLVPHQPEHPREQLQRVSTPFGSPRDAHDVTPGTLILVETDAVADRVLASEPGHGRVAVARDVTEVPMTEVGQALSRGQMVDVRTDPALGEAVRDLWSDQPQAQERIVASGPPARSLGGRRPVPRLRLVEPPPRVPEREKRRLTTDPTRGMAWGRYDRYKGAEYLVADSAREVVAHMRQHPERWGKAVVAQRPEQMNYDEIREALSKGWQVSVATRNDTLYKELAVRFADYTKPHARLLRQQPPPSIAKRLEHQRGAEFAPEMQATKARTMMARGR